MAKREVCERGRSRAGLATARTKAVCLSLDEKQAGLSTRSANTVEASSGTGPGGPE